MRKQSLFFLFAFLTSLGTLHAEDPALLNVKKLSPRIVVEMRYATTNNFTKQILYPVADECLLCEPAARRLARVQENLERQGLGLKIWDCYRPVDVQQKLWDVVPDPRYVADPKIGSRHNRGASVDLTLVDKNGKELPMPTEFDEFTVKAHRTYMNLPADILKNRQLLQDAMESEGFISLPTEWWHFDAPEWTEYALRNEPLGSPLLRADKKAPVEQIVLVLSKDWPASSARLQRFEKKAEKWTLVGEPWDVSLGANGLAWGKGSMAPNGNGPIKKEGDLTSTAGYFRIGKAYGYEASAPPKSQWPYDQVTDSWRCIDDPKSPLYNRVLSIDGLKDQTWDSAEKMKRPDHLYKWVINIEQNTPAKAGCGSCIFFHVWRDKNAVTEGCTAMEEKHMVDLLKWLDPKKEPRLIQLPEDIYNSNKAVWGLP